MGESEEEGILGYPSQTPGHPSKADSVQSERWPHLINKEIFWPPFIFQISEELGSTHSRIFLSWQWTIFLHCMPF